MRVERLDLHAYGHYQDTNVDLAGPTAGLTVVHGPNEAGKSTARRALMAALFGIERDSADGYRAGVHALRVGARVRGSGGGTVTFVRRGLSHLEHDDGSPLEDEALEGLLGGVDRAAFSRLFAVDHDELQRGSAFLLDAEGEIGRLVFGASLGSGSVAAVLRRLDERAADLYRDRGSAQAIPRALKAYREGIRAARDARVRGRDWERLRREADDAERGLAAAREAFEAAQRRQLRLSRTRAAQPLVTRRRGIVGALDELDALDGRGGIGGPGAIPDARWAERASEALAREHALRTGLEATRTRRDRLASEAGAIAVPETLLAGASGVDALVEGIGRYEKDTEDLPKRRTELEAALDAERAHLQRLGKTSDDGQVVADADLVAIEQLAGEQKELLAAERIASDELERARALETEVRARLAAQAEPPDVTELVRALERARTNLGTARDLAADRAAQASAAQSLDARATRLGLGACTREELEGLAVPQAAVVDVERARRHEHRSEAAHVETALGRLSASLRTVDLRIEEAVTRAPDPARVASARVHRDEGWRAVRAAIEGRPDDAGWAGGRPLPDAFEDAVRDADRAADERDEHAEAIAAVSQLRAQRSDIEQEVDELTQRRAQLDAADARALEAWQAVWARIGVEARTPDEMAQWLADEREVVATVGRWREQETKLRASEDAVGQRVAELARQLAEVGEPPRATELEALVAQADALVERVRSSADSLRDTALQLDAAQRDVPHRSEELQRRGDALAAWRRSWADALRPLGLSESTGTEAALAAVSAHRGLAGARTTVASLERRIEGIENDRHRYEGRVGALAGELLTATDARTPRDAVSELQRQLLAARRADERRQALAEQVEQASAAVREGEEELALARRALSELREEAGLPVASDDEGGTARDRENGSGERSRDGGDGGDGAGPGEGVGPAGGGRGSDVRSDVRAGVDEAIERARRAASLRERLAEIDDTLIDQADGLSVAALEADALAAGDTLGVELDQVSRDVAFLQQGLEAATARVAGTRQALAQVTDATTAADLEQDAEAELALAAEHVSEYARTALAGEILRRTISDYSERHRGPLLDRAAALFTALTGGAFTDLVTDTDGDRQVLLATRTNGELCTVPALSDGTRDQLYLALRLAALEHQIGQAAEPLPVVFDDILVHFDDERTEAALRALGDLGARTQVLLFTHHERVVEITERALAPERRAVVRLAARRHDVAAHPLGSTDVARGVARNATSHDGSPTGGVDPHDGRGAPGSGDAGDAGDAGELILAALRSVGTPLGKAALLERTGVPAREWPGTIRGLIERGRVVQEGERRGARYRLPGRA